MSGGHYNYQYHHIFNLADDIRTDIKNNDVEDDFGFKFGYTTELLEVLEVITAHMEILGKMAKEIEWLYSDDIGEETFLERIEEIIKGK